MLVNAKFNLVTLFRKKNPTLKQYVTEQIARNQILILSFSSSAEHNLTENFSIPEGLQNAIFFPFSKNSAETLIHAQNVKREAHIVNVCTYT